MQDPEDGSGGLLILLFTAMFIAFFSYALAVFHRPFAATANCQNKTLAATVVRIFPLLIVGMISIKFGGIILNSLFRILSGEPLSRNFYIGTTQDVSKRASYLIVHVFGVGTAPAFVKRAYAFLLYLVGCALGLDFCHSLFTHFLFWMMGNDAATRIEADNDLFYIFDAAAMFLMLSLILFVLFLMRALVATTKELHMAIEKNSRTARLVPLVLILALAFAGFYLLDSFKAVAWLVFLVVSYPVMAAFSSSLIDGTRFNSESLTGIYVQSLKSLPLIQSLVGRKVDMASTPADEKAVSAPASAVSSPDNPSLPAAKKPKRQPKDATSA